MFTESGYCLGAPAFRQYSWRAELVSGLETANSAEALAEEVGHFDKEGAAVATETGFQLTRKPIEAVVVQVVVVANVESRSGIRCPAKQKLSLYVRPERI